GAATKREHGTKYPSGVRHACRIFSISLAFLIGIIVYFQSTARYRQRPPRDRGYRRSDAVSTFFHKKMPAAQSWCGTPATEFAARLDRRRSGVPTDRRNRGIRHVLRTGHSMSWS